MAGIPALASVPPGIVNLADHEAHARTVLDDNAWAYFSGGAADEITLRANRSAWDGIALLPRVLRPMAGGHTRVRLLGREAAHPVLLAPVAFQRMAHPDGELATAYAAAAQGAGLVLSCQASTPLESVAAAARDAPRPGPLWFQLYMQHDRGFVRELVARVEQAGYEALVLTVDAPATGARDRERRAGFRLPPHVSAVNLQGLAPMPHATLRPGQSAMFDALLAAAPTWDDVAWLQAQTRLPPHVSAVNLQGLAPMPHATLRPGQSAMFDALLAAAPTWDDVAWLQAQTRLPVLLKGVLHEEDARQAVALQVAGLVVSNHGGRTLDTAAATALALPRIAQAVRGACPLLVDGGIRRGTDILKAVALGAQAVLVGRPCVHGLANAGAMGVAHVLRLLLDELEIAMALCGCATLDQATPALLLPSRG